MPAKIAVLALALSAGACYNTPKTSDRAPGSTTGNPVRGPSVGPGTTPGGSTAGPQPQHIRHEQTSAPAEKKH